MSAHVAGRASGGAQIFFDMNKAPQLMRSSRFVEESADLIISHGQAAIERSGLFRMGLAGGNTPRAIYEALAARPDCLPWPCAGR